MKHINILKTSVSVGPDAPVRVLHVTDSQICTDGGYMGDVREITFY